MGILGGRVLKVLKVLKVFKVFKVFRVFKSQWDGDVDASSSPFYYVLVDY